MHFHLFGTLDFPLILSLLHRVLRELIVRSSSESSARNPSLRIVADMRCGLVPAKARREIAGVMLDQESDETFVRTERRAMNADRDLVGVVAIFVAKIKPARLGEIDLIGREGKLATDDAPGLHSIFGL